MKIASWNVNSLSVRLPHVLSWLKSENPDVLALQETKTQDIHFPAEILIENGYQVVYAGEKSYNGVALLTKIKTQGAEFDMPHFPDPQRRLLAVSVNDFRIINVYVPNGAQVGSEKYKYKLIWLSELEKYLQEQIKKFNNIVLLGDFNIAPEDCDVHDPKAWEGQVLVSPAEREKWQTLLKLGLVDAFRLFKKEEKQYSWWDYRMNAFKRDRGLRIDHILVSENLKKQCRRCDIDPFPRTLERPSVHLPLLIEVF